jgi:signal transduction histidine kinase
MLDMGRVLQGREAVLRSYADHATHELKSPLTVVRGAAELLAEGGLSEADQVRMISRIENAASRMAALLDAQRALARAQEPLGQGRAPLGHVVTGLAKEHAKLAISCKGDAVLPLPMEQLQVVLGHLFSNAAAHGATEVAVTARPDGFDIADNGPGVSAGNRARVFDPFFTTRREVGGTGMGLAIVRRMLEAHGGQIALAEAGPGARFTVRF